MNYQIRAYPWAGHGSHVILAFRGRLDLGEFKEIFLKIKEMTETVSNCKLLLDLVDAQPKLDASEVKLLVTECGSDGWLPGSRVAMVSAHEAQQQLLLLTASLANRGFKIAAFYDSKSAADWLTETV